MYGIKYVPVELSELYVIGFEARTRGVVFLLLVGENLGFVVVTVVATANET
jgi:hypothetical protein